MEALKTCRAEFKSKSFTYKHFNMNALHDHNLNIFINGATSSDFCTVCFVDIQMNTWILCYQFYCWQWYKSSLTGRWDLCLRSMRWMERKWMQRLVCMRRLFDSVYKGNMLLLGVQIPLQGAIWLVFLTHLHRLLQSIQSGDPVHTYSDISPSSSAGCNNRYHSQAHQ